MLYRPITRTPWFRLVALVVCVALAAIACGSDDDDEDDGATTTGSSSVASTTVGPPESTTSSAPSTTEPATTSSLEPASAPEACEPYFAVSEALGPVGDPSGVPALLDQIEQVAPAAIDAELMVMIDGARTVLDSGGQDFSPFETPEFRQAANTADRWMYDNCVFETRSDVDAEDYNYIGIDGEYPPGLTAFYVTNTGEEVHELVVLRRNDGVTDPWDDLLALPEEEALENIQLMASTFVDVPGSNGLATADLVPGEYLAACFIAVGTTVGDDGFVEGDGPPHYEEGMRAEFTVS